MDRPAPNTEAFDSTIRIHVFTTIAQTARVPTVQDIARALGQPQLAVEESLRRLAAGRVIVLAPGSLNIWMANPFSAVPTSFRAYANDQRYYGNCIWDALGIPAILHADARIEARCGDCGDALHLEVTAGGLTRSEGLIHFAVPAARWWDNIGSNMASAIQMVRRQSSQSRRSRRCSRRTTAGRGMF